MADLSVTPPPGWTGTPDTRTRILQIAADLFRKHGYAGTSMRDISEQLGTSKAALYYHFQRKEDILDALVAPVLASLDAVIAEAEAAPKPDPATLLRAVVMATVRGSAGLGPLDLPEIVQDRDDGRTVSSRMDRIARLLAGPDGDELSVLRGHAALGAMRGGMLAAARTPGSSGGPSIRQEDLEARMTVVIGAALAALGARQDRLRP